MTPFFVILRRYATVIMGCGFVIAIIAFMVMVTQAPRNPAIKDIAMAVGTAGFVVYLIGRIALSAERRSLKRRARESDDLI